VDDLHIPEDTRYRTVVEVDLGVEPITGLVLVGDGRREPFSGYLGLLAVLRRLQQSSGASCQTAPAASPPRYQGDY
jgi:hypothetical protein